MTDTSWNMHIPYRTSKDTKLLFEHVLNGLKIACFVDNFINTDDEKPFRDICSVTRFEPYDIIISARGITYASVSRFNRKDGSEYELFKRSCESINLEWIVV